MHGHFKKIFGRQLLMGAEHNGWIEYNIIFFLFLLDNVQDYLGSDFLRIERE